MELAWRWLIFLRDGTLCTSFKCRRDLRNKAQQTSGAAMASCTLLERLPRKHMDTLCRAYN